MDFTFSESRRNRIHPLKFALWVGCASILMMFGSLTSGYVVRKASGNWLEFPLPNSFLISAGVIFLSSIVLQLSYKAFVKENEKMYKLMLVIATFLGFTFVVFQYMGWLQLYDMGVLLDGNPAGSFIYAISGLHAAHVVGGIGVLCMALIHAFGLKFKVTPKRKTRFELTLTYWHFVDMLWLYLLGFLLLQ